MNLFEEVGPFGPLPRASMLTYITVAIIIGSILS